MTNSPSKWPFIAPLIPSDISVDFTHDNIAFSIIRKCHVLSTSERIAMLYKNVDEQLIQIRGSIQSRRRSTIMTC